MITKHTSASFGLTPHGAIDRILTSYNYHTKFICGRSMAREGAWYGTSLGPILPIWFNVNPTMDMRLLHSLLSAGWNYIPIPKLQRCNRWSLGIDKWLNPTLHWACDYLSMLGLTLKNMLVKGLPVSLSHKGCYKFESVLQNNKSALVQEMSYRVPGLNMLNIIPINLTDYTWVLGQIIGTK